ncbi:hypothetical protein ASPCADRAFT_126071 [Aspergillus carbonarius ITEM 5010]|uniref:Uncharacterized protein n=1 Tax=Aspergillus carbonarius (strain ITEM 5010) TaxID=602072 RepID=A0A1R3S2S6_ASPC5|nr:hypothetical protein ASPCADRAFT_126071 [Aspergillus carbonarius ITEM 5010]
MSNTSHLPDVSGKRHSLVGIGALSPIFEPTVQDRGGPAEIGANFVTSSFVVGWERSQNKTSSLPGDLQEANLAIAKTIVRMQSTHFPPWKRTTPTHEPTKAHEKRLRFGIRDAP